jgi:hypothetical protein
MPLQATSGAASYDAFGGGVPAVPNYIEEVFSTWLYTGNNTGQTITNGIDLSTKGGMTLLQCRSNDTGAAWNVYDTLRGVRNYLVSSSTAAQSTAGAGSGLTAFNANGFTLGTSWNTENFSPYTYASWTFRKQPKFFDVVTYTGTGSARTIAHSLGSVPGCIIVKRTDASATWTVYHRSLNGPDWSLFLNSTDAQSGDTGAWNSTAPTSSVFTVGTQARTNASGGTFVAYIFAHDAGGFGLTGTDNVISCGSFTTDGSGNANVTLGYEPQWLMFKKSSAVGPWYVVDTMRAFAKTVVSYLNPNSSGIDSEVAAENALYPTATGFGGTSAFLDLSSTYIYVAIRRGPMKVPTTGTTVFSPITYTGNGTTQSITPNFTTDLSISTQRTMSASTSFAVFDRLRGRPAFLKMNTTGAEIDTVGLGSDGVAFDNNVNLKFLGYAWTNSNAYTYVDWAFRRAPSFFDEVCYTGNATAGRTINHNLGVTPELVIAKRRSATSNWRILSTALSQAGALESTSAFTTTGLETYYGNDVSYVAPTSSVFTVGSNAGTNGNGNSQVAYLFATCAGVSKVGSYTGTGTTKQVDCGFTGGARFVLIKRADSTGDWYAWDTARGIVSGNDPYLLLNSTAAEVTTTDYIDPYSAGFEISSTAPAAINANGGTFIFLAIA